MTGIALAFSWLTVFPIKGPNTIDRNAAGKAIAAAPVVGLVLGAVAAGALWLTSHALTPLLAGLIAVGILALLTRGMHIDGLADTIDGLGSYGSPERAREVMKSGGAGPFGVAALIFAIGIQAAAFAHLAEQHRWAAVVAAVALGRVAVVIACRQGIPAAPDAGFGALVAGTQSKLTVGAWTLVAIIASAAATTWWLGPLVAIAALAITASIVTHCLKRFGGLSGDVLGATVEITTCVAALGFSLN
ncbi:adenosylcobinamide-GDP ribazoletransferase [Nocardia camponoti]|uniref:Adenosylcobinamide-GDP ribazoletransferase n=1 Tax=Nocardia camponoti TaxID=1616106 RepID=A0A917VE33_9NOCA|nr:adenosylcobinamide-GDP ribazoletransferase [Nocardia camponoti]GGK66622.1 adenosylcobinamide-GDP ribazoletransferase [Nocardia camponoti]